MGNIKIWDLDEFIENLLRKFLFKWSCVFLLYCVSSLIAVIFHKEKITPSLETILLWIGIFFIIVLIGGNIYILYSAKKRFNKTIDEYKKEQHEKEQHERKEQERKLQKTKQWINSHDIFQFSSSFRYNFIHHQITLTDHHLKRFSQDLVNRLYEYGETLACDIEDLEKEIEQEEEMDAASIDYEYIRDLEHDLENMQKNLTYQKQNYLLRIQRYKKGCWKCWYLIFENLKNDEEINPFRNIFIKFLNRVQYNDFQHMEDLDLFEQVFEPHIMFLEGEVPFSECHYDCPFFMKDDHWFRSFSQVKQCPFFLHFNDVIDFHQNPKLFQFNRKWKAKSIRKKTLKKIQLEMML